MEVRDAETGERLVIASPHAKPRATLPLLPQSPVRAARSRNNADERPIVFPETQSTRPIGATVDWQREQHARVERAERRFRASIRGLRRELQRRDLDRDARQAVEIQVLEKMKAQYADQVRAMVVEEVERELAREVDVRLEQSAIGKERLRKKHARERAFHKAQIERVRAECETSLVASTAQFNLLR